MATGVCHTSGGGGRQGTSMLLEMRVDEWCCLTADVGWCCAKHAEMSMTEVGETISEWKGEGCETVSSWWGGWGGCLLVVTERYHVSFAFITWGVRLGQPPYIHVTGVMVGKYVTYCHEDGSEGYLVVLSHDSLWLSRCPQPTLTSLTSPSVAPRLLQEQRRRLYRVSPSV